MQIDSRGAQQPSSILKKGTRQQKLSPMATLDMQTAPSRPVLIQKVVIAEEAQADLSTPNFKTSSPVYSHKQVSARPFSTEPLEANSLKKAKEQYVT